MRISLILSRATVSGEAERSQREIKTQNLQPAPMRTLIIGCGYIGLQLGWELVRQGHEVWGMQRTTSRCEEAQEAAIKPVSADITKPETLEVVPKDFDWIVNCVSASGGGAEEYRRVYLEGMSNLLRWLGDAPPQKFVYTSSTSVYGQTDGSRVDETSPTEPASAIAQVLLEAEQLLLDRAQQRALAGIVLRVAGIYGPGRGYWLKEYLAGRAKIEGDGQRVLNMVHRNDVAAAIICALNRGIAGQIYNVADNEPVTQRACMEWLAGRLGLGLPACVPEDSMMTRKRGKTSKRVSNRKLRTELDWHLAYPTFREGFEAELQQMGYQNENCGRP
jgi:nucleoside-diphosphate-sugar epimerase